MTEDLFRIVYCSHNAIETGCNEAEFRSILSVARRNNRQHGVTGALLYNNGMFAQTLEGTFESVQNIFERIQVDHRHSDVVILQANLVPNRTFGDWAMAYAAPSDPAGANTILAAALATSHGGGEEVLRLLDRVVRCQPELSSSTT